MPMLNPEVLETVHPLQLLVWLAYPAFNEKPRCGAAMAGDSKVAERTAEVKHCDVKYW